MTLVALRMSGACVTASTRYAQAGSPDGQAQEQLGSLGWFTAM